METRQAVTDATASIPDFAMLSRKIAIVGVMALYPAGVAAINQYANQISEFIRISPKHVKLRVIPHLAPHFQMRFDIGTRPFKLTRQYIGKS